MASVQAFDAIAESYDRSFTDTEVGRMLRRMVWRRLEAIFEPGTRILELNCGTGEDAVWLAARKIRVLATDGSAAMLRIAARKAAAARVSDRIDFAQLDLANPVSTWPDGEFDGAISNFGGLNCVSDLNPLARMLGRAIKPGGNLVIVIMGRCCAWEILWHLIRLHPRTAFRRVAPGGTDARIGNATVRVWYHSARSLRKALGPEFKLLRLSGLGVFLPPSYLQNTITERRHLLRILHRLEEAGGEKRVLSPFGDHIFLRFERTKSEPGERR